MGVSISEGGNIDLDAIVAGGEGFVERIKAIKAAKDEHDASLEALNIGRDVVAAQRDAQAREQAATQLHETAKADVEQLMIDARAKAAEVVRQGQVDLDALMAKANSDVIAIDAQVKDAHKVLSAWSEKVTNEATALTDKATATKAEADRLHAENQAEAAKLASLQAEAKSAIDMANQMQAALTARLDAIKAAAS